MGEKWQFYTMKEQWQSIIAREVASTNWWVENNQVLGNKAVVTKVFCSYHALSCASSIAGILCYHLALLPRLVGGAMASIPLALSTAVYVVINVQTIRMKVVADNWFVHWERQQIGKLLVAFISLYTVQQCIVAAFIDLDDVLCSLIFAPFFVVITYGIHHVSTYGIFAKNSSDGEKAKRRDLVSPLVVALSSKLSATGTTPPQSASKRSNGGWTARNTVSTVSTGSSVNMVQIAKGATSGRESGSEEKPARPVVEATEITFNRVVGKYESYVDRFGVVYYDQ